ncbi:hypothetical protein [Atopobium sp. oral taxon 416]|nr:hypothetical protein [Atopobium sp. oral taxon 416]
MERRANQIWPPQDGEHWLSTEFEHISALNPGEGRHGRWQTRL